MLNESTERPGAAVSKPVPIKATGASSDRGVVYVVDDEPAIRDALVFLLKTEGYDAYGFGSAHAFFGTWRANRRSCIVADVRMPAMSGLEMLSGLRERSIRFPVIMITGHADVPMAVRAMKAGAVEFLEKPFDDERLLQAVERAMALPALAIAGERTQIEASIATLTPREREVMLLIAAGKPNKVISTELELSVRTVEVHRARVMEKMRAESVADLVRMSIATELLPL